MTSTADNLSVYQEGSTPVISLILSILFIVVAIVGGGTLIYIGNENLKAKHAKKLQKVGQLDKVEMVDGVATDAGMVDGVATDADQENTARVDVDKKEEVVEQKEEVTAKASDSDKQEITEQPKVVIN